MPEAVKVGILAIVRAATPRDEWQAQDVTERDQQEQAAHGAPMRQERRFGEDGGMLSCQSAAGRIRRQFPVRPRASNIPAPVGLG